MRLDDIFHLPALADAFAALVADRPALVVVAGLDQPDSGVAGPAPLLSSGRATIFRVLAEALLAAPTRRAAVIAADAEVFRVPRVHRARVAVLRVQRRRTYAAAMVEARVQGADLLIFDRLTPEVAPLLAPAVQAGAWVLAQLPSAARGVALVRELADLGVAEAQLPDRIWTIAMQRLTTLCPACRQAHPLTPLQRLHLAQHPASGLDPERPAFTAPGCSHCGGQGRSGTVALFDVCRLARAGDGPFTLDARLPLEQYAGQLALRGDLSFDDAVDLDAALSRRIVQQVVADEQALRTTARTLERNMAELSAANAVLQQRTAALITLQTIGQALLASTALGDLAHRVCRHVCELCHADRAALYVLEADGSGVICAVSGWEATHVGARVEGASIVTTTSAPSAYADWPPGIPAQHPDRAGGELRAGLCVPLIAEQQQVGMLIIHSLRRDTFAPAETALLQTLAHQAALLIQRTRLIDQLQAHIVQLREAQSAMVEQQRLAREMELAAEVQRSILPRVFPSAPRLSFAANNQPARQVGGDFYDVFALDDTTIGIVIADVSGKGMPAALYMALTRSLLLAEARRERSPRAVLLNVNRLLREVGEPQMFVTVFYGIITTTDLWLTFARAGHDYPLLLRDSAVHPLTGTGAILGMLDGETLQLSEERIELHPGDRLALYTDGLIDIVNPASQRFELPRLRALLLEQRHAAPAAICAAVFAALAAYQDDAEQFDDMTMVVVGVE